MAEEAVVEQIEETVVTEETDVSRETTETTESTGFLDLLSDEFKEDPSAQKFKDVNGLFKSYKEMEAFRGKQGIVPPDPDNPEDVARYNRELGIPEASDKYTLDEAPEWVQDVGYNQDLLKELMFIGGVSDAKANAVQEAYLKFEKDAVDRMAREQREAKGLAEKENRSFWGEKYDQKIKGSEMVADKYANGDQELADQIKGFMETNPKFRQFMAGIGDDLAEHRIGDFEVTQYDTSPEAAKKEMAEMRADLNGAYMSNKDPKAHKEALARMEVLYKIANQGR